MDFSAPGFLRECVTPDGYAKYYGQSRMISEFVARGNEESGAKFSALIADEINAFLKEHAFAVAEGEEGRIQTGCDSFTLHSFEGEFPVKLFKAIQRTELAMQSFSYVVHPEELDVVLRSVFGPQYAELFDPAE